MTEQHHSLWQAFQQGDRQAFEALLNAYYRPLFDYGSKFIKDRQRLKDCVHDLFVHLWERRAFLGDVVNVRLYLYTALRHVIFKEKRQWANWADFPEEWEALDETSDSYAEERIIADETEHENQQNFQRTIQQLTKRQQEILHLKFYANLTNDQIAEVLAISRPAVANLLYQSIKSLRHHWQLLVLSFLLLFL